MIVGVSQIVTSSSEQQFVPNLSFFEHYDIMVQFVRQFFGRPINGHLRKTSRDLHKRDVIFVILSLYLWKPTIFSNKSCSNLGPKITFLKVKTTLHVFLLVFKIFWRTFWYSHYIRGCKNVKNGWKFVKKPSGFKRTFSNFQHFCSTKVWRSKSGPKNLKDSSNTSKVVISYKKKLKNWKNK